MILNSNIEKVKKILCSKILNVSFNSKNCVLVENDEDAIFPFTIRFNGNLIHFCKVISNVANYNLCYQFHFSKNDGKKYLDTKNVRHIIVTNKNDYFILSGNSLKNGSISMHKLKINFKENDMTFFDEMCPLVYKYKAAPFKIDKDTGINAFIKRDHEWDLINSGQLYIPTPDQLNDPFDCDYDLFKVIYFISKEVITNSNMNFINIYKKISNLCSNISYDYEDKQTNLFTIVRNVLLTKLSSSDPLYEKIYKIKKFISSKEIKSNIRILSLTTKPTNLLMWSYYSEGHQGFCVEYDNSSIQKALNLNKENFYYGKVFYTKTKPSLTTIGYYKYFFDDSLFVLQALIETYFTKYKGWIHEDEVRYVVLNPKNPYIYIKPNNVAFGCNCKYYKEVKNELAKSSSTFKTTQICMCKKELDKYEVTFESSETI